MRSKALVGLILCLVSSQARTQPYGYNQGPPTSRDLYCRQQAAAQTGYVSPGQAARRAQTTGTVGGLLGGAALGAIFGGRRAGTGAAIGAGVGASAGTAIGSANANAAAADVQQRYASAYYACMNAAPVGGYAPPPDAIDGPPTPPQAADSK
jgi:hypothetical protein